MIDDYYHIVRSTPAPPFTRRFLRRSTSQPPYDFDTLEQLLASDYFRNFASHPGFVRFSVTDNGPRQKAVMAEYGEEQNNEFHVIGFLAHVEGLDLPEWEHGQPSMSDLIAQSTLS